MKLILTLIFITFCGLSCGRSPEKMALDFYASNIPNISNEEHFLSYQRKIKLRYDKHVLPMDSQYQDWLSSLFQNRRTVSWIQ